MTGFVHASLDLPDEWFNLSSRLVHAATAVAILLKGRDRPGALAHPNYVTHFRRRAGSSYGDEHRLSRDDAELLAARAARTLSGLHVFNVWLRRISMRYAGGHASAYPFPMDAANASQVERWKRIRRPFGRRSCGLSLLSVRAAVAPHSRPGAGEFINGASLRMLPPAIIGGT